MREISAIEGLQLYMIKDEVQRSMTEASDLEMNASYARAVGRRTEFLLKNFKAIQSEEHYQEVLSNGQRKLILRFLLSPSEIKIKESGKIDSMIFEPQRLLGEANS